MRFVGIAAAIAVLTVATAARESAAFIEAAEDHHDHRGTGSEHHHGDADDRHDGPDSPCEHPDQHCSCPPALTLALQTSSVSLGASVSAGTALPSTRPRDHVSLRQVFHIPIA